MFGREGQFGDAAASARHKADDKHDHQRQHEENN